MKKIIFNLITLMILFCIIACDEPKVNIGSGTDNGKIENETELDMFESTKSSLTVPLNKISDFKFTVGEYTGINIYYDNSQNSRVKEYDIIDFSVSYPNDEFLAEIKSAYSNKVFYFETLDEYIEDRNSYNNVVLDEYQKVSA